MARLSYRAGLRYAAPSLVLLLLVGCSSTVEDGIPIVTDGTFTGTIRELSEPGSTYKMRQRIDDAKCREAGHRGVWQLPAPA